METLQKNVLSGLQDHALLLQKPSLCLSTAVALLTSLDAHVGSRRPASGLALPRLSFCGDAMGVETSGRLRIGSAF